MIEKGTLLTRFAMAPDLVDKWSLACLFYEMAVDNKIDFEDLVQAICKQKNVPYQKPGLQ